MRAALIVLAIALPTLSACSGPQLYGAGQAWQRNECQKLPDAQEQQRCRANSASSYEAYQRERAAAAR